jgi:N-acetylglutamate synthase/N-acetylornithine aminotransferase
LRAEGNLPTVPALTGERDPAGRDSPTERRADVPIGIDLGRGRAGAVFFTCDLAAEYVKSNGANRS